MKIMSVCKVFIFLFVLLLCWSPFIYFYLNNNYKESVLHSLTGDLRLYYPDKFPGEYSLNDQKISFSKSMDENELKKFYPDTKNRPADAYVLRIKFNETHSLEICGFEGMDVSCIVFGNFNLDDNEEMLLVYYKDLHNQVSDFTVVDFVNDEILLTPIGNDNNISKLIKEYFKSTYSSGFSEASKVWLTFLIGLICSIIGIIGFIVIIFSAGKKNKA
jgi:hypothetical protein